jgi:hypothetical protein
VVAVTSTVLWSPETLEIRALLSQEQNPLFL